MHVHCFQHVPFETTGSIAEWIVRNHHTMGYTRFFEPGDRMPSLKEIDCLLVMGGPMNVDEEEKFKWLNREKLFIRQAIDMGKRVIGICLGAQLVAAALDKKVYRAKEKEIGFFPVTFTDQALHHELFNHFPGTCTVFHWHGDTFDLPDGAILIASTGVCPNQAFLFGPNVLCLQFHLETSAEDLEIMMSHEEADMHEGGAHTQTKAKIQSGYRHLDSNKRDLSLLLDKFLQ